MQSEASWFGLPLASSPWPIQLVLITALAVLGVLMTWKLIIWQNKSTGLSFKDDYWPQIKKSPFAVVAYRLGIYALIGGMVGYMLGRFA